VYAYFCALQHPCKAAVTWRVIKKVYRNEMGASCSVVHEINRRSRYRPPTRCKHAWGLPFCSDEVGAITTGNALRQSPLQSVVQQGGPKKQATTKCQLVVYCIVV